MGRGRDCIQALARRRDDMIGAAAAVERVKHHETPHTFRARIIAYIKPENIVVTQKADRATAALQQALEAVERSVRQRRETRGEPWEKP